MKTDKTLDYGPEFILRLPGGSSLRIPPHPKPCSYVRLVDPDENEEVYWSYTEWMEGETQAQEVKLPFHLSNRPKSFPLQR